MAVMGNSTHNLGRIRRLPSIRRSCCPMAQHRLDGGPLLCYCSSSPNRDCSEKGVTNDVAAPYFPTLYFSHHVVCAKSPSLTPVPVRRMPLAKRSLAPSMHDVHHSVRTVLGAEPGRHPRLPEAASLVAAPLRAYFGLNIDHAPPPVRRAVLRTFSGGTETADLLHTIRYTLTQACGDEKVTGTKPSAQN